MTLSRKCQWSHRWELKCDEPRSIVAFNLHLRRYVKGIGSKAEIMTPDLQACNGRALQVDTIKTQVERTPGFSA